MRSLADGAPELGGAELLQVAYAQLRELAERYLRRERIDHTLQPTALVHEAWLRLEGDGAWRDRTHFFATAARAMRHVLVDHARARRRAKRGGGWARVELDPGLGLDERELDLVDLDRALAELAARDERQAALVELRFFGGLAMPAVAEVLGVSLGTAERDWRFARAWLARALNADDEEEGC
ncbi:MAG: sigma-70 family RNA polymerase sigma factor [Planctomycetes bacterium]|nr:sigma-70 family RNA polymerase sigma factor [Planctomycetota bacterium]